MWGWVARMAWLPLLLLQAGSGAADEATGGDGPRLRKSGVMVTQEAIESGTLSLPEIRHQGLLVFSTPLTKADGYGDGPMDPDEPLLPGGRPTLQDNGMFLRVNGLDAQSCLECHSIVSQRTVPARFGVGGAGASAANALFRPTTIDVTDQAGAGFAGFDGRFINPPFLFGSGGVQLLALEMTEDLQALAAEARANPGVWIPLLTKGVDFGAIRSVDGVMDTTRVEGIDDDLVVRPFGRKGEFATVRQFGLAAFPFHFGMQPVEVVGVGVDADGDDVVNEILVGEVSALEIFATTLERPHRAPAGRSTRLGEAVFRNIGCADCHKPYLVTRGRELRFRYPEVPTDPSANVYYRVDLSAKPPAFRPATKGGLIVPLFADLKRHDMGPELAESFGGELDWHFTTARLWGVADSEPYLHDGRATTLREAILWHGGEARPARDAFAGLGEDEQAKLLEFLNALRTPEDPASDLKSFTP